jgi:hypothetical protein
MKSFSDTDVMVRVEFTTKDSETMVRIYNDRYNSTTPGLSFIELTFPQFQRVMAVGSFLIHPAF